MKKFMLLLLLLPFGLLAQKSSFIAFDTIENRRWIGADFWANRLQNWEVKDGKLCCTRAELLSTCHLLTYEMRSTKGSSEISFEMGRNTQAVNDANAKAGIIVGLSDEKLNYKARAMIQEFSLKEDGIWIGVKGNKLFAEDLPTGKELYSADVSANFKLKESIKIRLLISRTKNNEPRIYLYVDDKFTQEIAMTNDNKNGSVAFAVGSAAAGSEFYFNNLNLINLAAKKERAFGPISTCLYSFNDNELNFSAQLMPFPTSLIDSVLIEVQSENKWLKLSTVAVESFSNQARLRNVVWLSDQETPYRVKFKRGKNLVGNWYEGTITPPNKSNKEVRIAAISCNGMAFIAPRNMDYQSIWTPYEMIEKKYKEIKPHLLVFLGDQMYESRPVMLESNKQLLADDYNYRWLLWCMQMNVVTKDLPTLIIMDDHDYLQGNLWGDGARFADKTVPFDLPEYYKGHEDDWQTDNGGFVMDADFIKRIQLLQTGHLPDAYSKKQGLIPNYFTTLNFNGVGMALLEDRKFKSSPLKALPDVPSIIGVTLSDSVPYEMLNNSNATLLGDEQLKMLDEWSAQWRNQEMKIVFTQSVYACLSSVRKGFVPYVSENITVNNSLENKARLAKDMDANGWPKSGRDTALKVIRKSAALLVGGDQHFPSITHQGISDWNDAAYCLTISALNNTFPRFFIPDSSDAFGANKYKDGFGNKITMESYSNPKKIDSLPNWYYGAPGFGLIVCDKSAKTYSMRFMDFSDEKTFEMEKKVKVSDNAFASSPYKTKVIKLNGMGESPLLTLKDINGNVLYSLRGNNLQLNVPSTGKYIVEAVGEKGGKQKKKQIKVSVKK